MPARRRHNLFFFPADEYQRRLRVVRGWVSLAHRLFDMSWAGDL